MKQTNTKSPIQEKPLRYPAQSLDEKLEKLINDDALMHILGALVFILLAISSWIFTLLKTFPNPMILTVAAVIVTAHSIYKVMKLKKEIRMYKQGRDGEREVGMNLELLREKGIKVYHDILCKDFNIDHILVGEQGIFVIETKTYSKPIKGKCEITYDGKTLSYNGYKKSDKPLSQAKANATWVKNYIKNSSGKDFDAKSVVVFPGWFIKSTVPQKNIWVLNPKGLETFISNTPCSLSKEDVYLISNRIEMYIRNFQK